MDRGACFLCLVLVLVFGLLRGLVVVLSIEREYLGRCRYRQA